MLTLEMILNEASWKIDDIRSIYYGKDHACRCGCKGTYKNRGENGFKARLTKLQKVKFSFSDVEIRKDYINIPILGTDDKCYTLYKKED